MANRQATTSIEAAEGGIRAVIKAARTPLPSHELEGVPVRRFVAAVCMAEVEHARNDFWTIVCRLNAAPMFDRHEAPDSDTAFRLPHEIQAGAALVWLSHLQAHDSDRHGPWARWSGWDREQRIAWLRRRRYLLAGLLRTVRLYCEARRAIEVSARKEAA